MRRVFAIAALMLSFGQAYGQSSNGQPSMSMIPSWGDITLVYGPGTDAAMDTPEAMEKMIRHWKARGFTGVYLRTDLKQFVPGTIIRHPGKKQDNPGLAVYWHIVDEILDKADPHTSAQMAAKKVGFEYWVSHPHIYSEGAPEDAGVDGEGRMVPWSYMVSYHKEHPEVITIDREGNKQWMVPEYAYPGVRAFKATEFAHLAKTYQPTGVIASMRSETSQLIPPPDHADQYGFNQPVVDDMKRMYNVDIMADPRFDWKSHNFKSDDPMVQNWRVLRGTYITQLYRDIRKAMRDAAPKVQFAILLSGEYVGPLMGNAKLDWRTWVDEGIMDVIIMPATYEATLDLKADKKGYLTDVRAGKGTVTLEEVKRYILKSKHPGIRVIQTGAPSYFYPAPPASADGWQCDAWYDAYTLAWYQRWSQYQKDVKDNGFVKFFEQTFDSFPELTTGYAGGYGDGRYHPEMRACPGVWYKLGDSNDDRPYVQKAVHHGSSGNAIALTGKELTAIHYSSPDRSLPTGQMDPAISNGKASMSSWIYRPTDKSGITVQFTGSAAYERDVSVRVAPGTGKVAYANGAEWVDTDIVVPVKRWTPVNIDVDLDKLQYSAQVAEKKVCNDISISKPKERFVTQHGVNIPIKVPSYRTFNALMFVPNQGAKELVYVDDVLVKWTPTQHYVATGSRKLLDETFESAKPGATQAIGGAVWRFTDSGGATKPFYIEKTTSYGPGVLCARANGGGAFVADLDKQLTPASAKGVITVDLDVFIRSDKDFPYMLPDPTTHSPHSTVVALEGSVDKPFAAVEAKDGTWRLWDGTKYLDTGKVVNYDVWNHLQIAIDSKAKTYRLVVQPIGEMPSVIGDAACDASIAENDKLKLAIRPSDTKGHISCYDNLLVTAK